MARKRKRETVKLRGLDGTNPLGVLAALGVQAAFFGDDDPPNLWWSDDYTPCAIVDAGVEEIANRAMARFAESARGAALSPDMSAKGASALKFQTREAARRYLESARNAGDWDAALASALVCEGPLSGKGDSKQTDFYFMAGPQQFLSIARKILSQVTERHVVENLMFPWKYRDSGKGASFSWDAAYEAEALSVRERGGRYTNLGAEALALMGLSFHPVFGRRRPATAGCGSDRNGRFFDWVLWNRPASPDVTRFLSNMDYGDKRLASRFGVFRLLRSRIRISDYGYGAFSPARALR